MRSLFKATALTLGLLVGPALSFGQSFVNFEVPHVSPLAMTPDGSKLLAVNTPDNRLEVFDLTDGSVAHLGSVPVGLDPVSVRARSNTEVWVVNHVSDSVSIVDLSTMNVRTTLQTADEPADVVFTTFPLRAFVSCSQANLVQVFNPTNLGSGPIDVPIEGEDPRAMTVSADGSRVYVAVFESGNNTTILGGGAISGAPGVGDNVITFPPNAVSDPSGPYGGVNPPPNVSGVGGTFNPPQNASNPEPPPVGLIVRKNDAGQWLDDNGGDWTEFVTGPNQPGKPFNKSGRVEGWDLVDHDVAIIDTLSLEVSYATGLMNICMAIAVNPTNSQITVVGTDAINEIRFEPVVNGRFIRVNLGVVNPNGSTAGVVDLNGGHLSYSDAQMAEQMNPATASQALRDMSLGDPRGIAWSSTGKGYVTGMGSNNMIVIDAAGNRAGITSTIELGEGPTGMVIDEPRGNIYVINRFEGAISVVSMATESETTRMPFYDPTPAAIKVGRKHQYDTHKNSGLGHIACASCHVDSRMDRLAWDLGDPAGEMKAVGSPRHNLGMNVDGLNDDFDDFHPMKGPMTTLTLQAIIGMEPFHWRGDRDGIEEFNPAFMVLQGDDTMLTPAEMQEYEDFLATIHMPPNPHRNFDNTLPTDLPLPGHFTNDRFGPPGQPMPNGNAQAGLAVYRDFGRAIDQDAFSCVICHTLPTGAGSDHVLNAAFFLQPIPVGPLGEHHLAMVSVDGSTQRAFKVPQLRNQFDKVGFEMTRTRSRAGFGFLHDGSVDSLARFLSEGAFTTADVQELANLVALVLSFSGSDLPEGSTNLFVDFEPPGPPSKDAHAAVGTQITVTANNKSNPAVADMLAEMRLLADADAVGLVAKSVQNGEPRGYQYVGDDTFQADRLAETIDLTSLRNAAGTGQEITFTVVPKGTEKRIGVDRDEDEVLDSDEIDGCSDPTDPTSVPVDEDEDGVSDLCSAPQSDDDGTGDDDDEEDDGPLTLTVNIDGQGGVSRSPNQNRYDAGDMVLLEATPAAGWRFAGWTGEIASPASRIEIRLTTSLTLTARFEAISLNVSAGGPYTGLVDEPVIFAGSAQSPTGQGALTYTWDFGDGASATGQSAAHTYAAAGAYTATLTVSSAQGSTGSASADVVINEQTAPAPSSPTPTDTPPTTAPPVPAPLFPFCGVIDSLTMMLMLAGIGLLRARPRRRW